MSDQLSDLDETWNRVVAELTSGSAGGPPLSAQQRAWVRVTRPLGLLDDMNNWAGPKYMIAEGDTYMKYPDDETFPQLVVNYVKLDRVPKFDDGWSPVLSAMRESARVELSTRWVIISSLGTMDSRPLSARSTV